MVSMGKGPNIQTFSLPLKLVAEIDTQPVSFVVGIVVLLVSILFCRKLREAC